MSEKIIVAITNFTMACVLVLSVSASKLYAQSLEQNPEQSPEQSTEQSTEQNPEQNPEQSSTQSQSLTVELTGTAAIQSSGDLQINPARLDFGLIDIGQSTVQIVQLSHIGAADAEAQQINAVSIIGGHASEFSTDFSGFITLVPGDVIEVAVTYTPAVPGNKSGSVRMDIAGSGNPHVLIVEAAARFPLTSNLVSNIETVNFGQVLQNVAKQGELVLTNGAEEPDAPVINIFGGTLSGVNPNVFNATCSQRRWRQVSRQL